MRLCVITQGYSLDADTRPMLAFDDSGEALQMMRTLRALETGPAFKLFATAENDSILRLVCDSYSPIPEVLT